MDACLVSPMKFWNACNASPQFELHRKAEASPSKLRSLRSGSGSSLQSMGACIISRSSGTNGTAFAFARRRCRELPPITRNLSCGAFRKPSAAAELPGERGEDDFWHKEFADAEFRLARAKVDYDAKPWENIMAEVEAEVKANQAKKAAELLIAMEQAREAVLVHLVAQGETARFANRVISCMEAKDSNWLLNVFAGSTINDEVLSVFRQEVHQSCLVELRQKLVSGFPSWHLTELQKAAVINRVLSACSSSELIVLQPSANVYEDALIIEAQTNTASFHCPICMEPLVTKSVDGRIDTSNNWFASYRKTEHWVNNPCGHTCCRSCMKTWAETAIDEHKLNIRCPAAYCSYNLWQQDLQELVSSVSFKRHQEHTSADYLKRLKACVKGDERFTKWLKSHCRPCPACHVIVSRSAGCDAMMCVCGTRFCYKCGFEQCKCGIHGVPDIWNPSTK